MTPVFELRGVTVELPGPIRPVRQISLRVYPGETLGIVGESGSGKSVTLLGSLGLIPGGRVVEGSVHIDGTNITQCSASERQDIFGNKVGMVFQNPIASLNPVMTIGSQIGRQFNYTAPICAAPQSVKW